MYCSQLNVHGWCAVHCRRTAYPDVQVYMRVYACVCAAGFGTAADHHVHHKMFKYNYGHLFMYWDMLVSQDVAAT